MLPSRHPTGAPLAHAGEISLDPVSALCKASGDPLRLSILRALRNDSFGVSELCQLVGVRQPALSHHLKVLAGAGLVSTRREGNSIFYRRSIHNPQSELEELQASLLAAIDRTPLPPAMRSNIDAVYARRAQNSRAFFEENAHKFREQQDLIASYEQYADTVAEVLDDAPLRQRRTVLEIGPGDGAFLAELAPRFKRVVAVDTSAEMLRKARERAASASLDNVELIHGDTAAEELAGVEADCVVINMVLHHTPSPAEIFADVSRRLAPGGMVLVTDLCRHDQNWARENCGDIWLGFDPDDLSRWAGDSGLQDVAGSFLAQRNGFQIQVRLFGHPDTTARKTL
jgi:ArsR family transcriptional regulator